MSRIIAYGEAQLHKAAQLVAGLSPTKRWQISITTAKSKRSLEQNDRFHAIVAAIADFTGNDPRQLKEWAKAEFGPYASITIEGKQYDVVRSSSTYTTAEMTEMMDRLEAWAATELGVAA